MPNLFKTGSVLGMIILVVGLPIVGFFVRQKKEDNHCALDGVAIEPIYRVRIIDHQNQSYEFCCIKCAQLWLAAHDSNPSTIFVTDETQGKEIEAGQAHFVTSTVVTMPTTRSRIHAFADERDAQKHAETFFGRVLTDKERPFHETD